MRNHYYKGWLLTGCFLLSGAISAVERVEISGAWVRAVPPVSKTTAAYFTLRNTSDKTVTLIGASADFSAAIEMHDMSPLKSGLRSMRRIEKIAVAPEDSVTFSSGALHLMLFRLERMPSAGESVDICLQFAEGVSQCEAFAVLREPL